MKKLYVAVLFIILSQLTIAQNYGLKWAKQMGGTSWDEGYSITTDVAGNVYTTGYFEGTVDFDPGAGNVNFTSTSNLPDIFIQKLDSAGNLLWVKQMGGPICEMGLSITTDAVGNVYTTGYFQGTVDFDPGTGTVNLTSIGYIDIYIQKLDSAGNLLWAKQMGSSSWDNFGQSITIDASGNVYTTGSFRETVDFDPGVGIANLTSAGYQDIFIQKLDSAGNLLWVKQMGGTFHDYGYSITTDAGGNVYTTGCFSDTVDFDPGTGTTNLTSAGYEDIFIQKLDSAGNFLWVKQMGGTSHDYGYSITTDAGGNVYTTGCFRETVDFDPGAGTTNLTSAGDEDIFIQKLDGSGNLLWVKQMGGTSSDKGRSITTDADGNVYTTGCFEGIIDFDPGAGTAYLTSVGNKDIFIQKLDSTGNLLWVKQMGGTNHDEGHSITIDACGNVYTTGCFWLTVDFDPGAGITNLTSAGSCDIFIQKLSQCIPSTGTDVITACFSYTWIDGITYTASNNIATHTLSNAAGCDSVVTLNLTIITIDNTVSKNGVTLTANEVGAHYQWLDCNNSYSVISGASNQSYTATSNGNYAVEITKNSCVDTSNCYSITNIGIIENSFGDKLVFYPNPTSGVVNLEFGSNYKNVQIIIRNSEGKLLKHQEFKKEQNIKIEIEGSKGIYLIEVISADKKAIIKVVKQ